MDKKNTIIGIALLGAAFALMFTQQQPQPAPTPTPAPTETATEQPSDLHPSTPTPADNASASPSLFSIATEATEESAAPEPQEPEQLHTLDNGYIRVTFTNYGGGIKYVEFIEERPNGKLKYPETIDAEEPYRFNAGASIPALALSLGGNGQSDRPEEYAPAFHVLESTGTTIKFAYRTPEGIIIIRGYQLPVPGDEVEPYLIQHQTRFQNDSSTPLNLSQIYVNAGTAPPTIGDQRDEFLNFGYHQAGKTSFIRARDFEASNGFLGMGSRRARPFINEPFGNNDVDWVAVKNQFFVSVLMPQSQPGNGIHSRPIDLSASLTEEYKRTTGVTGALSFDLGRLAAAEEQTLNLGFYVGPKEYYRLKDLGDSQDEIMQFGWVGGISKLLLGALRFIHDMVVFVAPTWAWGLAIIILTVLIKGLMWPLTQVQVRSAKRMAELSKPMKEIQEKYADTPEKKSQEMMKLWQEHKINPAAGCFPILIQMPIFIGLFFMLRSSSELRFAPFLWISDLSVPDTVFSIFGFPINILPLLMVVSQVMQMRMTPSPSADPAQRKLMQFMPVIFLFICYGFPSGVVLYWTVQTALGIVQQMITNRIKDDEDVKIEQELAQNKKGRKAKKARR